VACDTRVQNDQFARSCSKGLGWDDYPVAALIPSVCSVEEQEVWQPLGTVAAAKVACSISVAVEADT